MRLLITLLILAGALAAQPRKILYFSHTAGFRHGSIDAARDVLRTLAPGDFTITASEDLALISAERLREFDAVFFYTSGELALNETQKRDLLNYVRNGGGFAGAHSATDTFYSWPEYGELIGAYFDGHPWVQKVNIDIEDPDHPITRGLGNSFELVEEVYQHRAFDRARLRVLLTLDTRTVNLRAAGVNRQDGDFALAWVHNYGRGRVFYTALGHFDEVFRDEKVRPLLRQAMRWITGLDDGDATPRGFAAAPPPRITAVAEAAQYGFRETLAPGGFVTIFGDRLTSGSTMAGPNAVRLAGTSVLLNGVMLPIIYAAPGQLNVRLPMELPADPTLMVRAGVATSEPLKMRTAAVTPGIFTATFSPGAVTLWCTGLGTLNAAGRTELTPVVTINGVITEVLYSGAAPGFPGLYQINVRQVNTPQLSTLVRLEIGGAAATIRLP